MPGKVNLQSRKLWMEVLLVTTLWMLLLGLAPLSWGINWPYQFWIMQVIFALAMTVAYFVNARYFVPTLLLRNKLWQYGVVLFISVLLILISMQVAENALDLRRLMHEIFRPNTPYTPGRWLRFDFPGLLITLLAFGISTSIELVRKGQKEALLRQELEKQQVTTELNYLKAQINPHFFFNTLNNIYALTNIDVDLAQKAIHMLSAMMRYVLYDSTREYVLVSQEMKFLENYIELMKLRLPAKATVVFEKSDTFQQELIAPMLLLPFIENAFKHGVSSQTSSEIHIKVAHEKKRLNLQVSNAVFKTNALKLEGSGIGLTNTRRRLELLYPDQHEMQINSANDQYTVDLSIDLTKQKGK